MQAARWSLIASLALAGCANKAAPAAQPTAETAQALTGLSQVADLLAHPGNGSSNPQLLVTSGSALFYVGNDPLTGSELWTSDGTAAGTHLVRDLNPGPMSGGIGLISPLDSGGVIFAANDGTHGNELWTSDGTFAGTKMIELIPGPGGANPSSLVNVNGTYYFSANDGVHGSELWKTDGTAAGTALVADLWPGGVSSNPALLTYVGGTLFFTANDGVHGTELWKSDGTAGGTAMVVDLNPGATGSNPSALTSGTGRVFFTANDGTNGVQLWTSDGTLGAATMLTTIGSGGGTFSALTRIGNLLVFSADDHVHGSEPWLSDGTLAGTRMIAEVAPGAQGSGPGQFVPFQGFVYFVANDGTFGTELWKTDVVSVSRVTDINPNGGSATIQSLLNFEDQELYFTANDGAHGQELWISKFDVAAEVADVFSGPTSSNPAWLTDLGGTLYFSAFDPTGGSELWKSDGTPTGTALVVDTLVGQNDSLNSVPQFAVLGGKAYFSGNDGTHGPELFSTDGTAAGTALVLDLAITPFTAVGSNPANFVTVGSELFFTANDNVHGSELWVTDGTAAGTTMPLDINPTGSNSSNPFFLTSAGDRVFFVANDGTHGPELWTSDGTAAGTVLPLDINPTGTSSSNPNLLTALGTKVLFTANDGTHGTELWISDGTTAGTLLVDLNPGSGSSSPGSLTLFNGEVYFSANDGAHGAELWKSDGTVAGTTLVTDLLTGGNSSNPNMMVAVGGSLYFWISDPVGTELWKTDGTAAGTTFVAAPIHDGIGVPRNMTAAGNRLFFVFTDSTHGSELWTSDGTAEGTRMVTDAMPGVDSGLSGFSNPLQPLFSSGGVVLYSACTDSDGCELWRSDGTAAGTYEMTDLNPGPANSNPAGFVQLGSKVLFGASDGVTGIEPWVLDQGAVVDTTPPALTCPSLQTAAATSALGATVGYPAATASDDFAGALTLTYSVPSGATFPVGATQVSVTASDSAGNASTCSFEVQVTVPAPALSTPAAGSASTSNTVAVSGTGVPGATVELLDGASVVALLPVDGTGAFSGSVTLGFGAHSLTVKQLLGGALSDASGATAITVSDSSVPAFAGVPGDLTAEATSANGAVVGWVIPTASDTKDGKVAVSCAPEPGSTFAVGVTPVVCTATDSDGHASTGGFNVTVSDNTAPFLACPADLSVQTADASGATVTFSVASTDRVSTPTVLASPASGTHFALGKTTVQVISADAAGNSAQCSFQVTVSQIEPLTTPPADSSGGCSASGTAMGFPLALLLLAGLFRRRSPAQG